MLACYGVLLWAPLIYDDRSCLFDQPLVSGRWRGLGSYFTTTFSLTAEFEPLNFLCHFVLFRAFGAAPGIYRATSLLLHGVNALLLWRFLRRRTEPLVAASAAALFAAFPAHVETLALTAFKKHLFVGFFALLMLNFQDEKRWPPPARALAVFLCVLLACFFKESGLILAPLAFAAALARPRGGGAREGPILAAVAAAAASFVLFRCFWLPRSIPSEAGVAAAFRLATSAKIFLWHLRHLAAPWPLSLESDLGPVTEWRAAAMAALGLLAWAGVGIFLWTRRERTAWLGWTLANVALLPFLNLVPYMNYSLTADRYEYLASAGFFIMVCAILPRKGLVAVPLLVAVFLVLGTPYAASFSVPLEVMRGALLRAPGNPRAHYNYGLELELAGRPAEAEAAVRKAISMDATNSMFYRGLATLLDNHGKLSEALEVSRVLVVHDRGREALAEYGVHLIRAGRRAEALEAFRSAAAAREGRSAYDFVIARGLDYLGRGDEAEPLFRRAAAADPDNREEALIALGRIFLARGRAREAFDALSLALDSDPTRAHALAPLAAAARRLGLEDAARARYDAAISRLESGIASAGSKGATARDMEALAALIPRLRAERDLIADKPRP